ncbi:MAG: hypothetical protein V1859_08315 [archaeon]
MPSQKILDEILFKLNKIEKEEEVIEVEELNISEKEKEIESILKKKLVTRKFEDILDWKNHLWETCPNKVEKEGEKELTYWCKKLKKNCNFTTCPLNFI